MARRSEVLAGDQGLQSLLAELHALRERVQVQHALLDVYAQARSGQTPARNPVELWEPVATRSARPAGPAADGEGDDAEPDLPGAAGAPQEMPGPAAVRSGAVWWPVEERAPAPLVPNAGWALYAAAANVVNAIGFSVCGLAGERLEQAVELIASVQREKRNFVPLFLTDCPDLEVFRRHGFTVEYLAATPPAGASGEAWSAYGRERREFLTRKWNLTRIVDFGPVTFGGGAAAKDEETQVQPLALAEPARVPMAVRPVPNRSAVAPRPRKKMASAQPAKSSGRKRSRPSAKPGRSPPGK